MALTPPTVTTDPADPTETNDAITAINDFVETSKNEVLEGLMVLRQHIQTSNGSMLQLDLLDSEIALMKSARTTDPSVVSNPVSQASMNAAAASMNAIVNVHRGLIARCLRVTVPHANATGASYPAKEAVELGAATVGGSGNSVTVPSNPVSAAEMNTALAEITANVDLANAAAADGLAAYMPHFHKNPAQLDLDDRLRERVLGLSTP
jgi:hypothetical protein